MGRWEPRTPKERLQADLERVKTRLQKKLQEAKELELQVKQVEQLVKSLG